MRNPPFSKQSSIWKWLNLDHEKDLSVERSGWIWGYPYAYNLWHLYIYIHIDTTTCIIQFNNYIYKYTKCFILRDTKGAPFSTPHGALTFHLFPKTAPVRFRNRPNGPAIASTSWDDQILLDRYRSQPSLVSRRKMEGVFPLGTLRFYSFSLFVFSWWIKDKEQGSTTFPANISFPLWDVI